VTGPAHRTARAELDSARSAVARLDATRGTEDLAADLIDVWRSIEAALRSLVGSTVLSGQPLIREARQRQLINFEQANSLAEFQAVHDRVQDTSYRPTEGDLNAARSAFLKLDTALMSDTFGAPTGTAPRTSFGAPADVKPIPVAPIDEPVKVVNPPRRFPLWMMATAAVLLIAILAGGYFALAGGGSDALDQGITAYRNGQREAAVSAFSRAAREDKNAVLPHVYLARMAREVGNFTLASQELQIALQNDPANATALREMGANLLAQGNYELARRFYVRAVQADTSDKTSQGYLGCALMRLNRIPEATTFLNRAGPGPWTNCTPATTQNQAGQVVPPAPGVIPR
jgi:tetratricopeptide (TPR) repeat protein